MDGLVILGAGLAGLGCARTIPEGRVFESSDHPGGHAYSRSSGEFHFDYGAHICHSKDQEWLQLILESEVDINRVLNSQVKNYWGGSWITYPIQNHIRELPEDDRISALYDFMQAQVEWKEREPLNYYEWCLAQYGTFITDRFYQRYTDKYWRIPMTELGTDWLSGRLLPSQVHRIVAGAVKPVDEEQTSFSSFYYPVRGGFFSFIQSLYEGLNITYNSRAVSIDSDRKAIQFSDGREEHYGILASSIPLPDLVKIIKRVPPEIREAAQRLRSTQLLCVNVIVKRSDLLPYHWFYIYDEDIEASRVSVVSNLARRTGQNNRTAIQAEIFRLQNESMNIDELVDKTVRNLSDILHFDMSTELDSVTSFVVPNAYVISDIDRQRLVATIVEWLDGIPIYTMGLFGSWRFIWSDEAYRSGMHTAEKIRGRH